MMRRQAHDDPSPAARSGRHRLLPIAGVTAAIVAVLAHLGGGALVMHVGVPALLVYFGLGADLANLGSGALLVALAAVVAMKLLLVFGAGRWLRQ